MSKTSKNDFTKWHKNVVDGPVKIGDFLQEGLV